MNRVICDVCGTKYPESAELCPICGCAKPENAKIVSCEPSGETKAPGNYTHVKGGRFSKSNVRKRNKAAAATRGNDKSDPNVRTTKNKDSSKGLIIAVMTLLLAIISVMLFVFFEYFMPSGGDDSTKNTGANIQTTTSSSQNNTTESTTQSYPCASITLSATSITFDKVGNSQLLSVELSPTNTTDALSFTSSNPDVASVNDNGLITAVADGNAVITVTCGSVTETCAVTVSGSSSDETTGTTVPQPEYMLYINGISVDDLAWGADVTLKVGESFRLTLRTRDNEIIEMSWSASKQDICSISGNEITAKAEGVTEIRAKHDGVTYKCTLRVK